MKKKYLIYIAIICILTIGIIVLSGCQNKEENTINQITNTTNNTNTTKATNSTSLRNEILNEMDTYMQNLDTQLATTTNLDELEKYIKEVDNSYKVYQNDDGVSFMYPNDWVSVENETGKAFASVDQKGAIVSISTDVMETESAISSDFATYMYLQKLYLKQNMTIIGDITEKQVNLNGNYAYIYNYITETEDETTKLNITQVAFADENNKVYILTLFIVNNYYNDYSEIFNKIIKSFIKE